MTNGYSRHVHSMLPAGQTNDSEDDNDITSRITIVVRSEIKYIQMSLLHTSVNVCPVRMDYKFTHTYTHKLAT